MKIMLWHNFLFAIQLELCLGSYLAEGWRKCFRIVSIASPGADFVVKDIRRTEHEEIVQSTKICLPVLRTSPVSAGYALNLWLARTHRDTYNLSLCLLIYKMPIQATSASS
jgi:hypothetical protein